MKSFLFQTIACIIFTLFLTASARSSTEAQLMQDYLDVVETAVDVYEPIWVDDSQRIPNSGFFDFRKYPDWRDEPYATIIVIPGNGMVQFCYAVLLTETDKQTFGASNIPRETILRHAIQSIRWCCLTSAYVEKPYPYLPNTRDDFADGQYWRRRFSWRADEVGWLTLAAALLWDEFDADTQKQAEAVFIGGAPKERLSQTWKPPQGGNHDQVKQDMSSTMGAAFILKDRPNAKLYYDIVSGNGIDMVSTQNDFASATVVDGTPISQWAAGWNLYPDYSSDHHGWCNLWYGSDLIFEGRTYIELLSAATGVPVPQTFTYPGNGFHGVLQWIKTLCLPQGEPLSPHGNEYDAYYGAGLLGYCYGAVIEKDPLAAALEERAAQLLQHHSAVMREYDYHRNSWAKAGVAYLMHKNCRPRAEPLSWDNAVQQLQGVYHYRWLQNLLHRSSNKIASFSWGSISSKRNVSNAYGNGLCGFVFPTQTGESKTEPLIYAHPKSLIGDFKVTGADGKTRDLAAPESVYNVNLDDGNLFTTGTIPDPTLDRYYAFHSFDEGPSVLLTVLKANEDCRVDWSGTPVYFYARDGVTPTRTLYLQNKAATLKSTETYKNVNRWCVDDLIGVLFDGGVNTIRTQRSPGYNWARKESYRDKCDGVYISPLQNRSIKKDNTIFVRSAIFTNTPHSQIDRMDDDSLERIEVSSGFFSALIDDPQSKGIRYFALSNFFGRGDPASIRFPQFEEGAPVLSVRTYITEKKGCSAFSLPPLQSNGEIIDMYVETLDGKSIYAVKNKPGSYTFKTLEGKTKIRVRYFGERIKNPPRLFIGGTQETPVDKSDKSSGSMMDFFDESIEYVDMNVSGRLTLDFQLNDRIAPAVDISTVFVREDGRVRINVAAADRSGVQSVGLYCDGESIGEKNEPPYVWTHRPGSGNHVYEAAATDLSENKNQRRSFKRPVLVP